MLFYTYFLYCFLIYLRVESKNNNCFLIETNSSMLRSKNNIFKTFKTELKMYEGFD